MLYLIQVKQRGDQGVKSIVPPAQQNRRAYAGKRRSIKRIFKRSGTTYVEENKNIFSELKESTYNLLSVMSRCSRLKQVKKEVEKEGAYDMCEAIEGIYQDGRNEGLRQGKREGQQLGHRQGRRQGRREGRQEGRLLGLREERKNMLLMILGKMGEVSEELEKKIKQEKDMGILEMWSHQALDAKSMEEFLQGM